jgi:hypothetical protein
MDNADYKIISKLINFIFDTSNKISNWYNGNLPIINNSSPQFIYQQEYIITKTKNESMLTNVIKKKNNNNNNNDNFYELIQ